MQAYFCSLVSIEAWIVTRMHAVRLWGFWPGISSIESQLAPAQEGLGGISHPGIIISRQ